GMAVFLYLYGFGLVSSPWLVVFAAIVFLAVVFVRMDFALWVAVTLSVAKISGLWDATMTTIYLVGIATVLSIALGFVIAYAAYRWPWVSGSVRMVCDLLQTIPQFVIIIPVLFFFQMGEVTAVISILLYAVVPMIRYVEFGFLHTPAQVIDACNQMGCTPGQVFRYAVVPSARPNIVLGINQSAIYALGMVVAAALVSSRDLGQTIFIALGRANAGLGITA